VAPLYARVSTREKGRDLEVETHRFSDTLSQYRERADEATELLADGASDRDL
jgi:hypothetical protein